MIGLKRVEGDDIVELLEKNAFEESVKPFD